VVETIKNRPKEKLNWRERQYWCNTPAFTK